MTMLDTDIALREEAAYYWTLHEASPVQPPPNTQNIRGYLLESGQSALSLPAMNITGRCGRWSFLTMISAPT